MNNLIYAMDTSFYHSLGSYTFEARCEMLRELGYDATYLTLWNAASWEDVAQFPTVKARYGLDVAGVYVTLDIMGKDDHEGNLQILSLLERLEGCTNVEVNMIAGKGAIPASDPRGDELAERWLNKLLPIAERRQITISLYHHINCWLERIEDCVRLCHRLHHPRLRTVFCGFHWYAADGKNLATRLEEAAPFLHAVNLCGCRHVEYSGKRSTLILPLDDGELDNFVILGQLQRLGYNGMIGLQGYSVAGDVYTKLKRSLITLRDMQRRVTQHPNWALLRPE